MSGVPGNFMAHTAEQLNLCFANGVLATTVLVAVMNDKNFHRAFSCCDRPREHVRASQFLLRSESHKESRGWNDPFQEACATAIRVYFLNEGSQIEITDARVRKQSSQFAGTITTILSKILVKQTHTPQWVMPPVVKVNHCRAA